MAIKCFKKCENFEIRHIQIKFERHMSSDLDNMIELLLLCSIQVYYL